MKSRIRRPSPALIVAFCALIAALAGSAVALPGKNNIDGNDLRRNVVKQRNIAKDAVTNRQTRFLQVIRLRKATAATNQADAPRLVLYTRRPLQVYAKCFLDGAFVRAEIYLRSFQPGALLTSQEDNQDGAGAEPGSGYVNPGEDENNQEISNDASAGLNSAQQSDGDDGFRAAWGNKSIQGIVAAYAKQGTLANGDRLYGAGNRCIFQGSFTGIG